MTRFRIDAALERATDDVRTTRPAALDGVPRTRRRAIGDPQAPLPKFLEILDLHGLLGEDGRLAPDVQLVSMGDHFDWGSRELRQQSSLDGLRLLSWLAAHPPDQVVLIAGNHDLSRVGELCSFDDAVWAHCRAEADEIVAAGEEGRDRERAFLTHYPMLPTAEIVFRDFATFSVAQQQLIVRLLREGRFRLGFAADDDLLLTHAGLTLDDAARIGVRSQKPHAQELADALNAAFDAAVAAWLKRARQEEPLAIPQLHQPGSAAYGEARGVLYHRPSNPDVAIEPQLFDGPLARRFDPRRLPRGLVQAIGHIRDNKCCTLLGPWVQAEPPLDGPLRYLRATESDVRYERGVPAPSISGEAVMLFLDGGMLQAESSRYELLDLKTRAPAVRNPAG